MIEGNVISGNGGAGLILGNTLTGVQIRGNRIGVGVTGAPLGNHHDGIRITTGTVTGVVIGGTQPGDRNIISANDGNGIWLQGGSGFVVKGNYIGTTAAGAVAPGFGNDAGIAIAASDCLIGGPEAGASNLIAGNNGGIGIVGGARNLIQGNVIHHNGGGNGVGVGPQNPATSVGNTISENSIYSNGTLGIDLYNGTTDPGGVTQNDSAGPLRGEPLPELPRPGHRHPHHRRDHGHRHTDPGGHTQHHLPHRVLRQPRGSTHPAMARGSDSSGGIEVTTDANGVAAISKSLPALARRRRVRHRHCDQLGHWGHL